MMAGELSAFRAYWTFSLIGILAKIASVLADNGISIFAVSTYNTDYVMVKKENFQDALEVLAAAGMKLWIEELINRNLKPG